MKLSILKKKSGLWAFGAAAATAALALTTGAGANPARRPAVPDESAMLAAVRDGRARPVPPSPADIHYSSFWQGCHFVLHMDTSTTYTLGDGAITVHEKPVPVDASPGPPCDVERQPTAQEIDSMKAQVDALNDQHRSPGAPPLPAYVPDAPRTGELAPTPPIPARS